MNVGTRCNKTNNRISEEEILEDRDNRESIDVQLYNFI